MNNLREILLNLKHTVKEQNFNLQSIILCEINKFFESVENFSDRQIVSRKMIHYDLPLTLNEMICSKPDMLLSASKVLCYISEVNEFWEYFPLILKNLLRALIFLGLSQEIQYFQQELIEVIFLVEILLRRWSSTKYFQDKKEDDFSNGTLMSMLKLCEIILKNVCIYSVTKLSIYLIYDWILGNCQHFFYKSNKIAEFINKTCEIGYLLIEILSKIILGGHRYTHLLIKVSKIFATVLGFICNFQSEYTNYHRRITENCFQKIFTNILFPYNFGKKESKYSLSAYVSTLNILLLSKLSSSRFKAKVFKYLRCSSFIRIIFITLHDLGSKNIFLSSHFKLLIFGLVSSMYPANDNKLNLFKSIFSIDNYHLLLLSYDDFKIDEKNFLLQNIGIFFYTALVHIKENILNLHQNNLRKMLNNIFRIMKTVFLKKRQLDAYEFCLGLDLFMLVFSKLKLCYYTKRVFQTSTIFKILLQKHLESDATFLPPTFDNRVLIWLRNWEKDDHLLHKLLPLYLEQDTSTINLRVYKVLTPSTVLYFLLSNNRNQVKNAQSLLELMNLSSEELAFLVRELNGEMPQENLTEIMHTLLPYADTITSTDKSIVYAFGLKIFSEKQKQHYCKDFYVYLFDVIVHFIKLTITN